MSTWKERARVYREILSKEGYRPELDEDDDIRFKCEGYTYWILHTDDEQYVEMVLPNFWSIEDDDELGRALLAASAVNRATKVAKAYARGDLGDMWITTEQFLPRTEDFGEIMNRLIRATQLAVDTFRSEMQSSA